MTIPRRILVPNGVSRCYHCISRCVRRAQLCGNARGHRREWIRQRLLELARIFAIEVGGYAIMGNHLHVLVRTQPGWVDRWSDREVARRWLMLFPKQISNETGVGSHDRDAAIQRLASDRRGIRICRQRLADLSWFMKCLKEPVARRANKEDGVTGHFWEGRFKVLALLDEAAVLACLAYIDLNPIRACTASTPEESDYTSIQDRIHVRQRVHKLKGLRARAPQRAGSLLKDAEPARPKLAHDEDDIWLIPVQRRAGRHRHAPREGLLDMTLDEYLRLVDMTGRQVRRDKPGTIPPDLQPILARLDLDARRWVECMRRLAEGFGTAIGSAASLASEAARRGTRRVVGALRVYGPPAVC